MKCLEVRIPQDCAYIIPIGDVHWGDPHFKPKGLKKLKGYVDWVLEHPNSRIFLLGDLGTAATRNSKDSPFGFNVREFKELKDFLNPVRKQIIGAIDGNHEQRILDHTGHSPTESLCDSLSIPYCEWSAVVNFKVGSRPQSAGFWENYDIYFHHTTGGSSLPSALTRIIKLQDIVEGCDVYCGGHNHQLVMGVKTTFKRVGRGIENRKVHFVSCGSYLYYEDSYAEMKQFAPTKLGSPRIRLSGVRGKHDVHISI